MKWFLVVYFIINGETFPGERFSGWSPREHMDEQSMQAPKDTRRTHIKAEGC